MKKFRIVALLLVMCLASSCFVGGTFAKYASEATGSDTAAIAKWSFEVDGTNIAVNPEISDLSFGLFDTIKDTYKDGNDVIVRNNAPFNVSSATIAPGTEGEFFFALENTSDVAIEYSVGLTATIPTNVGIEFTTDKDGEWTKNISELDIEGEMAMGATENTATIYWRWVFDAANNTDTAAGIAAAASQTNVVVNVTFTATQVD